MAERRVQTPRSNYPVIIVLLCCNLLLAALIHFGLLLTYFVAAYVNIICFSDSGVKLMIINWYRQ